MAPARYCGGRRRGVGRAPFLRTLDGTAAWPDQRPMGGRSRRTAADPQHSRPAVLQTAAAVAAGRDHRPVSGTGRAAMSVAIIDYGSGNLHSAAKAFELASRSMEEPQKIMVTRDPDAVFRADRIVL